MAKKSKWMNWSKTAVVKDVEILYPTTEDELVTLVKQAQNSSEVIRVAGSGHSFTSLIPNKNKIISLSNYHGLVEVDEQAKTATFKAGTSLKDASNILDEYNLAFENMGDINVQSIAGALSTGTHGSGINYQSLSNQIVHLRIINGIGEIIECSQTLEPELFKAAKVSLGSLGILSEITIQAETQYMLEMVTKKEKLEVCLENLEEYIQNNRSFEFYWFPYTNKVQLKMANVTTKPKKHNRFTSYFNDIIMENKLWGIVCKFSKWFPRTAKYVSKLAGVLISEGTKRNKSHLIYPTVRQIRFVEMEYSIPKEHAGTVLLEIKEFIEKDKIQVQFPIEVRFVKQDDIYLSPAYQRDSCYIAIHMYQGMVYEHYFQSVEGIFNKYDGRPHWGKLHWLDTVDFYGKYEKFGQFQELRRKMDPYNIFMNDHLTLIFRE